MSEEADLEVWSNTSKDRLGFWALKYSSAFFGDPVIHDRLPFNIFLNEAIAILAAIHWSTLLHPTPHRLAIHTNSSNSFNIFNSLCASDPYNSILMSTALIRIDYGIDLRIFFIEGKQNTIADALSHHSFDFICNLVLNVSIRHFMPPSSPTMLVMGVHQE